MNLPPIYVVHLTHMSDRRRRLKRQLRDSGFLSVTWIEGVNGNGMDPTPPYLVEGMDPVTVWPGWIDPYARRAMTMGEIGCSLSHVRAWQQIAKSGEPGIIIEDDAMPVVGVIETLPLLLNDLSYVDFDLVYLAQHSQPGPKMLAGRHVHVVDYHPMWTLAYLLSAEAATALLNTPWATHLCPSDELLPAAFGLNKDEEINNRFHIISTQILSSNQRFFTPAEGSETSLTEKSKPVIDPSIDLACLTVASDDTSDLQRLCASGRRYGRDVTVLGLGVPWKGGDMTGPGGGQKVNLLRAGVAKLPATQPVLFIDGYDTIITRHVNDMLGIWRNQFNGEPVFAAEVSCWPDADRADDFPVPENDSPYRFLNSGAFLATAGDLREMLKPKIKDSADDQRYYTDRFFAARDQQGEGKKRAAAPLPPIHLDTQCQLFQCLNGALGDVEVDSGRGMIRNTRFDSWPTVIHANGPTKAWLEQDGRATGGRWRRFYGDMEDK